MGFVIMKVLMFLILPPACLLIMLLAGFLLVRKRPASGGSLIALALLLLYVLSLPLAADMLIRPLERAYPRFSGEARDAEAIVVLGGGVLDLSWVPAPPTLAEATLTRVVTGVELARAFQLPLVMSGGSGAIDGGTVREAGAMADQAIRLGIPAKNVTIEDRSRNTRENARAVKELLGARPIILVTSAFHMKRAVGMFTKLGFLVIPAPTDYRSESRTASWTNLLPRSENLNTSSRAIAEYLSLTWYRMSGAL